MSSSWPLQLSVAVIFSCCGICRQESRILRISAKCGLLKNYQARNTCEGSSTRKVSLKSNYFDQLANGTYVWCTRIPIRSHWLSHLIWHRATFGSDTTHVLTANLVLQRSINTDR